MMKPDSRRTISVSCERVRSRSEARAPWWLIAGFLLAAFFAGKALRGTTSPALSARQTSAPATRHQPTHRAIETIRVGQRVVTSMVGKPDAERATDTEVDPATWRLLRLRAEDRWADGTLDVVEIETLQSPEWIAAHGATVGAKVPLPLDLHEMGLPESLQAKVTANEPCPPLSRGPGRVVLTTVNHLNPNVLELTLVDPQGRQERLRPTGSHKFFSEDRQEFVAAEELREGEQLQGASGRLTLLRAERVPGVHRVYNMTVEREHVYRVSLMGALVHNNCPPVPGSGGAPIATTTVSRWGRPGLETGDWVMKGGVNYRNYVLSGKWQPGFTNQFAPYGSGQTFVVPPSSVIRAPGFWGAFKYPLGQRIYVGTGFPAP